MRLFRCAGIKGKASFETFHVIPHADTLLGDPSPSSSTIQRKHTWMKEPIHVFPSCVCTQHAQEEAAQVTGRHRSQPVQSKQGYSSYSGEAYKYQKHSPPLSHFCLGSHVPASLIFHWRHVSSNILGFLVVCNLWSEKLKFILLFYLHSASFTLHKRLSVKVS